MKKIFKSGVLTGLLVVFAVTAVVRLWVDMGDMEALMRPEGKIKEKVEEKIGELEEGIEAGREDRCLNLDIGRGGDYTNVGDRIRRNLRDVLDMTADKNAVDVIIQYKKGETPLAGCLEELKGMKVRGDFGESSAFQRRFHLINAVSARLTRGMIIDLLIKDSAIKQIEYDTDVVDFIKKTVPRIGADKVHDEFGVRGKGVKIAVIDTGVASDNEALAGKIAASKNFTADADAEDLRGHGTHTACIIACDNDTYLGVAPGSRIYNVKVIDTAGKGKTSTTIAGMEWAVNQGVDIMNLSLGAAMDECDGQDALSAAADAATEAGVIVVAAAGNSGPDEHTLSSPACARTSIAVGAVDKSNQVADFSSRGPTDADYEKPDIFGPGVEVKALTYQGVIKIMSGTSQAAPHVAGLIALLKEVNPGLDRDEALAVLTGTQREVYGEERGAINAYEAVRYLGGFEAEEQGVPDEPERDEFEKKPSGEEKEEEVKEKKEASEGEEKKEPEEKKEEVEEAEPEKIKREETEKKKEPPVGEEEEGFDDLREDFSACVYESGDDQGKRSLCSENLLEDQKEEQFSKISGEDKSGLEDLADETAGIEEVVVLVSDSETKEALAAIVAEIEQYVFVGDSIDEVESELAEVRRMVESGNTDSAALRAKLDDLRRTTEVAKQISLNEKFKQGILDFKDVDDNQWFFTYVADLKRLGCVGGYKGSDGRDLGEFRPFNGVTVAEGLKICLECAGYDEEKAKVESVVVKSKGHWAEQYFNKGAELGLSVTADRDENPDRELTRAEMVILLFEVFQKQPLSEVEYFFVDLERGLRGTLFIESARVLRIVSGDANAPTFRPKDPVTRAEMAKVVLQGMGVWKSGRE